MSDDSLNAVCSKFDNLLHASREARMSALVQVYTNHTGQLPAFVDTDAYKCVDLKEKEKELDDAGLQRKQQEQGQRREQEQEKEDRLEANVDVKEYIEKKLAQQKDSSLSLRGLSTVSLDSLLQWFRLRENKFKMLQSRFKLQTVQMERIYKMRVDNDKILDEIKRDAMSIYGVDLDNPKSRESLPEDARERFYGMYVARKEVKSRLDAIEANLEDSQLQYQIWYAKELDVQAQLRNEPQVFLNRVKAERARLNQQPTRNDKEKERRDRQKKKFDAWEREVNIETQQPENHFEEYFAKIRTYLLKIKTLTGLRVAKGQIAADVVTLINDPFRFGSEHFNLALLGRPGTGKTNLVKYIAPLYKLIGIVPPGNEDLDKYTMVAPNDLQSSFQAATAVRTAGVLMRYAVGGVLFIDEAYGFGMSGASTKEGGGGGRGGNSGSEAITQMVATTEEFKGLMLVIVAGYEDLMQRYFFDLNPGLNSRFPSRILLPDYKADELYEIFINLMQRAEIPRRRTNLLLIEDIEVALTEFGFELTTGVENDFNYDNSQRKLKAVLQIMKDYDDERTRDQYEKSVVREARIRELQNRLRVYGAEGDYANVQLTNTLLEAEINEQDRVHRDKEAFENRRLFSNSNARGAYNFFALCEEAWAARKFSSGEDILRVFIEDDISKATYNYTHQMLGLSLDWVDQADCARLRQGEQIEKDISPQQRERLLKQREEEREEQSRRAQQREQEALREQREAELRPQTRSRVVRPSPEESSEFRRPARRRPRASETQSESEVEGATADLDLRNVQTGKRQRRQVLTYEEEFLGLPPREPSRSFFAPATELFTAYTQLFADKDKRSHD